MTSTLGGVRKRLQESRLDALRSIARDPDLLGDLVGREESDAADLEREAIGLLVDDRRRCPAVALENALAEGRADAVALESHHRVASVTLLLPRGAHSLRLRA